VRRRPWLICFVVAVVAAAGGQIHHKRTHTEFRIPLADVPREQLEISKID
jgi:hypothetical protein